MKKKKKLALFRANIGVFIVIMLAILFLVNFISYRNNKRFDVTSVGRFSLSDQTGKILNLVDQDLQMLLFDKASAERLKARDLLEEYRDLSSKVTYRLADPDQEPGLAKEYGITKYGSLVLEMGGKQELVEDAITEEQITNAILKLTSKETKVIYFLEGHGERPIDEEGKETYTAIKYAVMSQNYIARKLLLLREAAVPQDCAVLVVAGPKKELLPEEEAALKSYLEGGGKALFLLDPHPGIGLKTFLGQWGIEVDDRVIIDQYSRMSGGDYFMPVITSYTDHPITRGFTVASFFPVARPVRAGDEVPEGVTIQPLALTSQGSWAETKLTGSEFEFNEGDDLPGPVSLAVVADIKPKTSENEKVENEEGAVEASSVKEVSKTAKDKEASGVKEGRLVVVGDSDFANNTYLNVAGNQDFFLNIVSWLAEEEELISIRPKTDEPRTISLTESQMNRVFSFSVLLFPILALASGIMVWRRRRSR